jgi:UDPglucose 6-dehydrogenase
MKIGIIGYGYVGSAVAASYDQKQLLINDPAHPDISKSIDELKQNCDAIYVCVPTPQADTGECDTSILESVIQQLSGFSGIVIAKSTASPAVYQQLEALSGLRLAHVPEFLTQVNAVNDYLKPKKIVVGCKESLHTAVADVILNSYVKFTGQVEYCEIGEASMFKYLANTMLAMKVVMNNEYYDLCQAMGLNWNAISSIASTDVRLGNTHWRVPGPDGQRGFGGACFPKDTMALEYLAENIAGVKLSMLSEAIDKNYTYRQINT